jgi:DNA-binding response OmpR family regulator
VLVITAAAQRAPSALTAGCDGILLKPFAPNLLHARIGRLLRARSVELHLAAQRDLAKAAHSTQQATRWRTGTNASWPDTICPKCEHPGATGFDHASHRRDWYACLACGHVWIAKRQQP